MKIGQIYKATNIVTGKVYIGGTTLTLQERIDQHYVSKGSYRYLGNEECFYHDLSIYDEEAWKWETIQFCYSTDNLIDMEKYWIDYYDATDSRYGYNIFKGGRGFLSTVGKLNFRDFNLKSYWDKSKINTGEIRLGIDYHLLEGIEYDVVNMLEKRFEEKIILDKLNISKYEYTKIVKSVENKYNISIINNLDFFEKIDPVKLSIS